LASLIFLISIFDQISAGKKEKRPKKKGGAVSM
jgi:hypothetical protein